MNNYNLAVLLRRIINGNLKWEISNLERRYFQNKWLDHLSPPFTLFYFYTTNRFAQTFYSFLQVFVMSFISRVSEISTTVGLSNLVLCLCCLSKPLPPIWPFSRVSLRVCVAETVAAAQSRRKSWQGTVTMNRPNRNPSTSPASTSHQWCRLSLTRVIEHVTPHMATRHCSHGFRNNVWFGIRACRYHCTMRQSDVLNKSENRTYLVRRDDIR